MTASTPFRTRPGRYLAGPALRLPAHRASSATLAGAYPFLAPPAQTEGVPVGTDALTGEVFCFDPWALYATGALTNPNVALAGVIGHGKSTLAKSLAFRSIAAGRSVFVPGDPKGEWAPLAAAVGGIVVRLGPGHSTRLNPLDLPTAAALPATGAPSSTGAAVAGRAQLVAAIASVLLHRGLTPAEHAALDAALTTTVAAHSVPVLGHVVDALTTPDSTLASADGVPVGERAADGRDLGHALRRLVRGDLTGMFDAPTTHPIPAGAVMVVLDLSALGSHDEALTVAMTVGAAWVEAALVGSVGKRWVIYDEAWRVLAQPALLRRMQGQWKLARAYGAAHLLILHRLSDLDAVGPTGSATRALAEGLLADCSTRVVYRQESDQVTATATALGLTGPERDLVAVLPRGTGLWKLPGRTHVVHHRLHPAELALVDTDTAMRDTIPDPALDGLATDSGGGGA
ncbi:ATP-binding protein [Cellulomonas endophytica]|uniref:ATP-binding protein n=1 Tax=Cellulomonas endophytica TaxID=2494735 RepID=UPI00196A280E|nr:ATP-binding protein [Cellulomonas endophytica]